MNERHADERVRELLGKISRGDRLSFQERRDMDEANKVIAQGREAREKSAAAGVTIPDAPGYEASDDEERAFTSYLRRGVRAPELRAAGEGSPPGSSTTAGGYLVPPGWWQRLQIAKKAYGGIQNDFQLLETDTGQGMIWATNNPTAQVGSLLSENTQIGDVDYVFGQGVINAYMFTSGVNKVSFQLAQDSAFDLDSFIIQRSAEQLGRAEAQYAVSGTGSSQPQGLITVLAAGASTGTVGSAISPVGGGYVSLQAAQKVQVLSRTPATSGNDSVSELAGNILSPYTVLAMIESVDPAYRMLGAKFYLNDAQLQGMRAIVDGFGRPLYPTLQGDAPSLYGYPVVVDMNLPNLTLSTVGGPVFGYLPAAMVLRRVKGASILRLEERYADFLQVGFIGFERIDIRANDLRAAVTVKPAAT
jgi:HK97 family phage major capsid protein